MNVQTREQFKLACADILAATMVVADTETNTLYPRQSKNALISISVYLPEFGVSYNFPFRYGQGSVQVKYSKGNPEGTPFEEMNWQGKAKKQLWLSYWFDQFRATVEDEYFQNIPLEWMDDLKDVWGLPDVTYVFHNARFDLHVLEVEGFRDPWKVEDTMIALHLVHEDWRGTRPVAPYKWTQDDASNNRCKKDQVGTWARDASGQLVVKKQQGNRQLKWQAAAHGFKDATTGEEGLRKAIDIFKYDMLQFIGQHWQDEMNAKLVSKKLQATLAKDSINGETWATLIDVFKAKLHIDEKANMWMLPSGLVAEYAELDTRLTWDLREWCLGQIALWDNLELYETTSRVHHRVAWGMERNGFRLDVAQAQAEIDKLDPRIHEIEDILAQAAMAYGFKDVDLSADDIDEDDEEATDAQTAWIPNFNVASNPQLLEFINYVLDKDFSHIFPEWFDIELKSNLKLYPKTHVEGTKKSEFDKVADHAIVRLVREYRKMKKISDTYLKRWLNARDEHDIVRFNMNTDGTVSGRMSSSGDAGNGQNIPDRGGYTIKRAIVPYSDDWRFVAIDYAQLELKLAAWVAETLLGFDVNMTMTGLFLSGNDMHQYVAEMLDIRNVVFGGLDDRQVCILLGYDVTKLTPEGQAKLVKKQCRQIAKTCNFGLLYSGGKKMLSKQLKISEDVAQVLVLRWRKLFPAFPRAQAYFTELSMTPRMSPAAARQYAVSQKDFDENTADEIIAVLTGATPDLRAIHDVNNKNFTPEQLENMPRYMTQPISNRHRKLHKYPDWIDFFKDGHKQGFNPREAASSKTWNNDIQGLGGYICTVSALNQVDKYGTDVLRWFAQIHDALDGFVHKDHLAIVPDLGAIMCDWPQIVPGLSVDISGSTDGTWQGISTIHRMDVWIDSQGLDPLAYEEVK